MITPTRALGIIGVILPVLVAALGLAGLRHADTFFGGITSS
jgi:hypothetical protein